MGADFSRHRQPDPNPEDVRLPARTPFESLYREIHQERLREGPRVVRESFRPILNLSGRGSEDIVVETLRRGARREANLTTSDMRLCAWEIASANFETGTAGFALTEKMVAVFFARDWSYFRGRERVELARLVAEDTLPSDSFGQTLFVEYVTGQLNQREESALMVVLAARGIRLTEVIDGELWTKVPVEPSLGGV